jgi:predicted O-methyltransferase YrrM
MGSAKQEKAVSVPMEKEIACAAALAPTFFRLMNSLRKAVQLGSRLLTIAVGNPKRLSHVLGTALSASDAVVDPASDLLSLRRVDINELLPESGDVWRIHLALFPKTYASISVFEFTCLILLMKRAKATRVFEFGTHKGVSITQLVLNLPPESVIYTLDLPEDAGKTQYAIANPKEAALTREKNKGEMIPADLKPRITFLQKDSAAFDDSPYAGRIDFVFVDGAHDYAYVKNDSEKGWRMLRSGGIMAWHDVRPQDPDVVRYLLESPYQPVRIQDSTVAFARKP